MLREHAAASPQRRSAIMAGLAAYQRAPRPPAPPPRPVVASAGRATLRDHRTGPGGGPPVVFVPSLINPPRVLDLTPDKSLLGWLADQGHAPLLVDWGDPDPAERTLDIAAHVTDRLLPLLAALPEPPVLVGYCLGGTMALAASLLTRVAGLVLIAAPWRFSGFSDRARADIADLWTAAEPACDRLGLVPMEVLQTGFWQLDAERTLDKYARFAALHPETEAAAAFVALEDWSNQGAPLTYAAGRELFDDFYDADLPGTGRWRVGGRAIDPAALACPAVEFVSAGDRIVPAASSAMLPDRRLLGAGHVGMVVGSRARDQLWEPLADWLSALSPAKSAPS
ncbi:alpha/beta fold hydrolase [Sphingomonas spermidinifaciens]